MLSKDKATRAANLKALRDHLGLKNTQLAEKLGTSAGVVSQYINGTRSITEDKAHEIYLAFKDMYPWMHPRWLAEPHMEDLPPKNKPKARPVVNVTTSDVIYTPTGDEFDTTDSAAALEQLLHTATDTIPKLSPEHLELVNKVIQGLASKRVHRPR